MTLKPFCIIILVFIIVLPGTAGAWFDGGRNGRPFSTRMDSRSLIPSGSLAVYDDIAAHSEGVVILPNVFFVPVDTIDLDIPLTLLVKTPVSSMEALDRNIVANLRLKLLIDEYKALQKRADELLKSVVIPYLDSPWLSPEKENAVSLNERKKRLDSRLNGILFEGHGLNLLYSDPVNLPPLGHSTGWMPKGKVFLTNTPPKDSAPVENSDLSPPLHGVVPLSSVFRKTEIPWIFAFFMKVWSYLLAHRLEVVLYGTILSFFGYLISLQARHGK